MYTNKRSPHTASRHKINVVRGRGGTPKASPIPSAAINSGQRLSMMDTSAHGMRRAT